MRFGFQYNGERDQAFKLSQVSAVQTISYRPTFTQMNPIGCKMNAIMGILGRYPIKKENENCNKQVY